MKAAVVALGAPEWWHRDVIAGSAHQHVVVGNALHLPILRAQGEGLADAGFPDKLLVQLADDGA